MSSVIARKSSLLRNKSAANNIHNHNTVASLRANTDTSLTFSDLLQKLRTKNGIAYTDFIAHNKHQLSLLARKHTADSASSPWPSKPYLNENTKTSIVYPEIGTLKQVVPSNSIGARSGTPISKNYALFLFSYIKHSMKN